MLIIPWWFVYSPGVSSWADCDGREGHLLDGDLGHRGHHRVLLPGGEALVDDVRGEGDA